MNVPGKAGQDLLLVSSEACVLLDGQDLVPRWTFGATQVLRYVQLLLSLSGEIPLLSLSCDQGLLHLLATGSCPSPWVQG